MTSANPNDANEETPLISSPTDTPSGQQRTPLPKLQLSIVLLLQLSEPIMSQSIYPYINQLISELGITGGDERKVGYYVGLIGSLFFATQAVTVLQWSRLSDHIGRKPVLIIGMVGSSLSMLFFGLSKTFWMLVVSRCFCGLLNGNVGVMKSVMGELTDSSNRPEGFSLLPVVWAAGATLGPLLGGSLSNPYDRFPRIFKTEFWKEYPYFLPCLASSSFGMIAVLIMFFLFKETVPKQKPVHVSHDSETSTLANLTVDKEAPLPLRQILTYPVVISIVNYSSLAFLDIMLNALLPLFFAMPVEIGGLGFDPPTIGYLFGVYGAATGAFNALCFVKIVRRFGEKQTFFGGISLFMPLFILMPIMSLCARTWGIGSLVWTLVSLELLCMVVMDVSYGCIFIYITASAPNKRSLGATNGLSQMTVSMFRAVGPALSTSLFSFSVQHDILGGYGVYLLMAVLVVVALVLATLLPTHVWDENQVQE